MTPADPGATPSAPGVASHEREVEERWMHKGHGEHSRMECVLSGEDGMCKSGTQAAGEGREALAVRRLEKRAVQKRAEQWCVTCVPESRAFQAFSSPAFQVNARCFSFFNKWTHIYCTHAGYWDTYSYLLVLLFCA